MYEGFRALSVEGFHEAFLRAPEVCRTHPFLGIEAAL